MPFSLTTIQGRHILKLEGTVTIRHAQELAAMLGESLEDGPPAGVDTRGLEDTDTCIVQLLYSMRKTGPALSFDNPSEVFLRAVDRCGLRRQLIESQEDL
jgi:anti-anti-sigma regulatory factor